MKNLYIRFCVILTLANLATAAFSQPGSLDPSFANNGSLAIHPEFEIDEAAGIALESNGKILMLSRSAGDYLIKFNSDGTPDNSFGNSGKLKILEDVDFTATAFVIDSLERIVIYGEVSYGFGSTKMALFRLLPDGTKDAGFGNDGEVETLVLKGNRALLIQNDGKILVGGGGSGQIAIIKRFNADGSMDLTFNGTGFLTLDGLPKSCVISLAEQADGKLLITGYTNSNLFIARINTDGTPDQGFNSSGFSVIDEGSSEVGQDIAVMPGGRIVVSGHSENQDSSSWLLWAFHSDGSIDNAFGVNGLVTLFQGPENNFGWFVFPDDDSTLIAGGCIFNELSYYPVVYHLFYDGTVDNSFGNNGTGGKTYACGKSIEVGGIKNTNGDILLYGTKYDDGNNLAAVSQLLSNGITDQSFGTSGTAFTSTADSFYFPDTFFDLAYLSDAKSLTSGMASYNNLFLMRLTADGNPDSTYAGDGFFAPRPLHQSENSIIASSDSIIYLIENYYPIPCGFEDLKFQSDFHFAIHKLLSDGMPDSSFGTAGIAYPGFPDLYVVSVENAAVDEDGKLLISGQVFDNSPSINVYLMRLNADGSADSTFDGDGVKIFDWTNNDFSPNLAIRSDGKIIFESFFYSVSESTDTMCVLRLLPDGAFDPSFGNGGKVDYQVNFQTGGEFFLQPDNKMVTLITLFPDGEDVLIRLNDDGSLDSGFGVNGYLAFDTALASPSAQLQADGKILCSGAMDNSKSKVMRYLADGTIDQSFGVNGAVIILGMAQSKLRLQSDGKILAGGEGGLIDKKIVIARLLNDGASIVEDNKNEPFFSIYPNPVGDKMNIQFPQVEQKEVQVSIIELNGRVVFNQTAGYGTDHFMIDVKSLPAGFYILKLTDANHSQSGSFVK